MPTNEGIVYIVGAGPGDYGLMTLKGLECIETADVIIYDRLVNEKYLLRAKEGCELIYAGKQSSDHAIAQDRLNELIAEKAAEGKIVTRLKGGDPFVFGRGGEEALLLASRGIAFEVVPGVSAFTAVAAYAGIPVTHRGYASTAAVITGHEDPAKETSDIDWRSLAGIGTLVFFMSVKKLPQICERLIAAGMPDSTPAALIERGTTPLQRSVVSDLKSIEAAAAEKGVKPPALLVVGKTVGLSASLNWFERRPLSGVRIVVTRAREQASELSAKLERMGATVYETPMIKFAPPDDGYASLKKALAEMSRYDAIAFTSVNGVSRFFERAAAFGYDARALAGVSITAIGEKTADALRARCLKVDIVPDEYRAEGLAAKIIETFGDKKLKILLARAQQARDALINALRGAGHEVTTAHLYKTVRDASGPIDLKELLASGGADMITFASSSTVDNFMAAAGADLVRNAVAEKKLEVAAIGPITAAACERYGITAHVQPAQYTIDALANAIAEHYAGQAAKAR